MPLELGRLLRLQQMLSTAAQTAPAMGAGVALARAYRAVRQEILDLLTGDENKTLREEFDRLFPHMHEPEAFNIANPESSFALEAVATEAQTKIRMIGGWVQGLIDEQTLERRLRMEAEENARLAIKPSTGFGQS